MTVLESLQRSDKARVDRYHALVLEAASGDESNFGRADELGELAHRIGKAQAAIANDLAVAQRYCASLAQVAKCETKGQGIGGQIKKLEADLKDAVMQRREVAGTADLSRGRVGVVELAKLRQRESVCRNRVSKLEGELKLARRLAATAELARKSLAELVKAHPWLEGADAT